MPRSGFFGNTGAVAGTFAAVGLALLAAAGGAFWLLRRRRRQRQLDEDLRQAAGGAGDAGAGTSRFRDEDECVVLARVCGVVELTSVYCLTEMKTIIAWEAISLLKCRNTARWACRSELCRTADMLQLHLH